MFSTSVQPSLNDLLQSYAWVLESVTSLNCAPSLIRISADFMFLLVRSVTIMHCAIADGITCSLIMITTYKKTGRHSNILLTVTGISPQLPVK
jgi:hypothetical protein